MTLSKEDAEGRSDEFVAREVRSIQERIAKLPVLDARDADDVLGYDEHGVPR